ncbi:unnamed protein product [Diamesa serratosioi]
MNISKWLPKKNNDINRIFMETRNIERELRILGKKFATNINYKAPDYYGIQELLNQGNHVLEESCHTQYKLYRMGNSSTDKNVQRSSFKVLLNRKALEIRKNLKRRHFQMICIVSKLIKLMLCNGVFEAAFSLCSLLNNIVMLTMQNTKNASGSLVISNTFPPLLSNPKRMDIIMILQMMTRYRTESCCDSLISCLLATCRADMTDENESDTSSLQIYLAITSQLLSEEVSAKQKLCLMQQQYCENKQQNQTVVPKKTPTLVNIKSFEKPKTMNDASDDPAVFCDPAINFFDNMAKELNKKDILIRNESEDGELLNDLIQVEDIFIAHMIAKCLKLCPSAFENEITKDEIMSLISKASRFLWTNVGGTLEHYLLWWAQFPLACRPVSCTKYLRDYLMLITLDNAPEPILSTLKSLGEILTVHAVSTSWDKNFRICLVLSSQRVDQCHDKNTAFYVPEEQLLGTTCGYFWNTLFQSLVSITNSCDQAGTIANELPIVEQIPVLHRLDHSIHTMRLWGNTKAKELCSDWNMKMLFRLIHNDMGGICVDRLNELRAPVLVAENPLEVHIQVNVALRGKLVEEIKDNTVKVKTTCTECIEILAAVCETTAMATLTLYFPHQKIWQAEILNKKHSEYVGIYLGIMYQPIILATKDIDILNRTMKIICESMLENIYTKQIKFTHFGALNLLKDFEGIVDWILSNKEIPEYYRDKLSKHEVLRMCEGVGKILLREPDEVISMFPSPKEAKSMASSTEEDVDSAPLPPEMFVPNQTRWLKLRARKPKGPFSICSGVGIVA